MKSRTVQQEIKGMVFADDFLKIRVGDVVAYKIGFQQNAHYSTLYSGESRFFVLYIDEINKESPQLYNGDCFEHRFMEPGMYTVTCLNYPKMRQTITVESDNARDYREDMQLDDNLSDISHVESEMSTSTANQESIFRQSEESSNIISVRDINRLKSHTYHTSGTTSLKNVGESNLGSIGRCIELITNGATRENIIDQYPDILNPKAEVHTAEKDIKAVHEFKKQLTNDDTNVAKKLQSFFDDAPILELKNTVKTSSQIDVFGKISEVHRINKISPDNLFQIFSRLKGELETAQTSSAQRKNKVFSSIQEMQNDIWSEISLNYDSVEVPKGQKVRRLKRAQMRMEQRFDANDNNDQ